jgi:hypothetical protein
MSGCIYRTKDNECELWTDDKHYAFCDPDCEDKHPSNADRIRSMTDEELAEFVIGLFEYDELYKTMIGRSTDAWLKWLKEEVKDAE